MLFSTRACASETEDDWANNAPPCPLALLAAKVVWSIEVVVVAGVRQMNIAPPFPSNAVL